MGFAKPDLESAKGPIRRQLAVIHHPYNDGFIQSHCKHELYMLKCWLEDEYDKLPKFAGEEEWEQERVVQILKRE
jgi:hypothetical protein